MENRSESKLSVEWVLNMCNHSSVTLYSKKKWWSENKCDTNGKVIWNLNLIATKKTFNWQTRNLRNTKQERILLNDNKYTHTNTVKLACVV